MFFLLSWFTNSHFPISCKFLRNIGIASSSELLSISFKNIQAPKEKA